MKTGNIKSNHFPAGVDLMSFPRKLSKTVGLEMLGGRKVRKLKAKGTESFATCIAYHIALSPCVFLLTNALPLHTFTSVNEVRAAAHMYNIQQAAINCPANPICPRSLS